MPDSFSDAGELDDEDREILQRIRAERARALAEQPDAPEPLPDDKTDFAIGIRPDGTLNVVDPDQ